MYPFLPPFLLEIWGSSFTKMSEFFDDKNTFKCICSIPKHGTLYPILIHFKKWGKYFQFDWFGGKNGVNATGFTSISLFSFFHCQINRLRLLLANSYLISWFVKWSLITIFRDIFWRHRSITGIASFYHSGNSWIITLFLPSRLKYLST